MSFERSRTRLAGIADKSLPLAGRGPTKPLRGRKGTESHMSAEQISPITTYFRVCDGVRVRFADTNADSDTTLLLLAPWPESVWAFRRIWREVAGLDWLRS